MADAEIAGLAEDTTPDSTDNVYAQSADGNTDKRVPLSALPISTATQSALDAKATTTALSDEATLARNADNLTSGTVADARIPSTIARDSEVAAAYQPADTELTALAGLTPAADRLPYFTGSGTAALATFTTAGRNLVDDVDAAAQRTTLGLGTAATSASTDFATAAQGTDTRTPTDNTVSTAKIQTDAVTAEKIAAGAVGESELASNAVTTAKITDANVTADKLASDAVTTAKILDANVTTAKIAANAVTAAKVAADVATQAELDVALDAVRTGWWADTNTWTRTGDHTFTVAVDATAWLYKGVKVSYNDGAVEYGVVNTATVSGGTTTVTLITNDDYAMAAATITAPRYSYAANPQGFPTWFSYTPTLTGWSSNPTGTAYRYAVQGTTAYLQIRQATATTSNTTTVVVSLPIGSSSVDADATWQAPLSGTDNGTILTAAGRAVITSGAGNANCYKDFATGAWTASGNKRVTFNIFYEV